MATVNTKFSAAVEKVIARVREMQIAEASNDQILVELFNMIHDTNLFTKGQRANVVKAVNSAFELKLTMNEIKAAVRPAPKATAPAPKATKAINVDGLAGTATVDTAKLEEAAGAAAADNTAQSATAPVAEETTSTTTDHVLVGGIEEAARTNATQSNSEEQTMRTPAQIIADAKAEVEQQEAQAQGHVHTAQPTTATTSAPAGDTAAPSTPDLGVNTDLLIAFLAAHPKHQAAWNTRRQNNNGASDIDTFKVWATNDPAVTADFVLFVQKVGAKPEEKTFAGSVMTTLRGERDSGLRSGVVAAAAAVVGGGLEMAFRGSASVGSALGTVVGATGAYFAAEAADGMMESEMGRYVVAGSIGVIAGGLGSRVGRVAQDRMVGASGEAAGVLSDSPAPAALPPVSTIGNSSALAGLLRM